MRKVFIFLFLWQSTAAQKVQILVPKEPVIIGNAFQVQFIFPNTLAIDNITPPVTDSIKLISGPNVYKGTATINGKQEAVQNVTFTLVASALGNVRIRETSIIFKNGEEIHTEPAVILVMPQIKASFNSRSNFTDLNLYKPTLKTDFDELISQNLFIKTEVSKKTCYVGEPIVATFKLYSRLQSSSEVVNAPSLYGFSVMDILSTNEAHHAIETISGKVFNTSVLRKLQLYPEQSGRLVIDPMELDNEIEFDDSLNETQPTIVRRAISSEQVPILVKALPAKKPNEYSGAVGKFRISAKLADTTIHTGQQGKLVLTISGRGNFIQLGPPHIDWPKEFDVFDPEVNDRLNKNLAPVAGEREYVYHFTLPKEGRYSIPPIRFFYFEPGADSFSSVQTGSLQVDVMQGSKGPLPETSQDQTKKPSRWWLFLFLLLPAFLLWWMRKGRETKQKSELPPLQQPMTFTEKLVAVDVSVLPDKEACLRLQKILTDAGKQYPLMNYDQKAALQSLLEDCQLLAYSSAEEEGKKEELKKRAIRLLLEIEK